MGILDGLKGAINKGAEIAGKADDGVKAAWDGAVAAAKNASPSDIGHGVLDVVGLVPVVGEAADLANAGWYAAEGNYTDAALSAAGAIPFAGWGATGAKAVRRGMKAVDAAKDAKKAARGAEAAADAAGGARGAQRGADAAADAGGGASRATKAEAPPPQPGGGAGGPSGPGSRKPPTGGGDGGKPPGGADGPGGGKGPEGGDGKKPSSNAAKVAQQEKAIDDYLTGAGHKVEKNPLEGQSGAGRQGDRIIDGVRTEYKTVSGVSVTSKNAPDKLSGAISSRVMDGRGQAGHIIVDARGQNGMTEAIARRGAARAYGADNMSGGSIQNIRIIGDGFDISVPRK